MVRTTFYIMACFAVLASSLPGYMFGRGIAIGASGHDLTICFAGMVGEWVCAVGLFAIAETMRPARWSRR